MKKTCALIIVIALIITLCSCKKLNNYPDNSSYYKSAYNSDFIDVTSQILTSPMPSTDNDKVNSQDSQLTSSENSQEASSIDSSSINESVDVSDEKTSSNENSNQETNVLVSNEVFLSVDSSRAPSDDVGSIISDGYIYYTNPTTEFPDGLFRKKISGGPEETITNLSVTDYKVLAGKVYYIHQNNLYSCDTDGNNVKKIYDEVSGFAVAGNWIFAVRHRNSTAIGKPVQELYAVSIDGSTQKRIQPDKSNEAGSTVTIHGFNRGYCYVTVTHTRYIAGEPNTISMTSDSVKLRIDYRSENLIQENLKNNTEYTYEGSKYYSFDFMGDMIRYDYVLQRWGGKNWIVSLKNNTATTLFESQRTLPQYRLKDYFVYIPEESDAKKCNIVFVDFSGTKKTFSYDWPDYGHNTYQIYYKQDIHGNSLLMQTRTRDANGSDVYTLYIVDSDGTVTEIYSKTS